MAVLINRLFCYNISMSANNQVLIKRHKGSYYVFENIMAESWCDRNCLKVDKSLKSFDTIEEALKYGHAVDDTEYGVIEDTLAKDGADVHIYE